MARDKCSVLSEYFFGRITIVLLPKCGRSCGHEWRLAARHEDKSSDLKGVGLRAPTEESLHTGRRAPRLRNNSDSPISPHRFSVVVPKAPLAIGSARRAAEMVRPAQYARGDDLAAVAWAVTVVIFTGDAADLVKHRGNPCPVLLVVLANEIDELLWQLLEYEAHLYLEYV